MFVVTYTLGIFLFVVTPLTVSPLQIINLETQDDAIPEDAREISRRIL
ncbi:hypothetical protein OA848_04660 [Rickettsiales bacterium]|nr:hypothetical protein [Rickettsiales bacterium]